MPCSRVDLLVVPQFLILHLYPDWPVAESDFLQQHVGAAGQIGKIFGGVR